MAERIREWMDERKDEWMIFWMNRSVDKFFLNNTNFVVPQFKNILKLFDGRTNICSKIVLLKQLILISIITLSFPEMLQVYSNPLGFDVFLRLIIVDLCQFGRYF